MVEESLCRWMSLCGMCLVVYMEDLLWLWLKKDRWSATTSYPYSTSTLACGPRRTLQLAHAPLANNQQPLGSAEKWLAPHTRQAGGIAGRVPLQTTTQNFYCTHSLHAKSATSNVSDRIARTGPRFPGEP